MTVAFTLLELDVPQDSFGGNVLNVLLAADTIAAGAPPADRVLSLTLPREALPGSLIGFAVADDYETVLTTTVALRSHGKPEYDLLDPIRPLHPLLARADVCASGIPSWLQEELSKGSDRPDHLIESADAAHRRCMRGVPEITNLPDQPGDYNGNAVEIRRVGAHLLSPADFFNNHVSTGLPVVLTGAYGNNSETFARWERRRMRIRNARHARLLDSAHDIGECDEEGCNRVHLCGEGCVAAATMTQEELPAVFNFEGSPMDVREFLGGEIFSGRTGQEFGGPLHFDAACDGSVSTQFEGTKRWSLWSPWAITSPNETTLVNESTHTSIHGSAAEAAPNLPEGHPVDLLPSTTFPPHTRFETVLRPGDILFFAPGFYHGTRILQGPSVAAVYYFVAPPVYGSTRHTAYAGSPFGFEHCRWPAKAEQWRQRMARKSRKPDGSLLSDIEPSRQPTSFRSD